MTKSTITRERIQRIIRAIDSEAYDEEEIREWLSSDEIMELSRMALAAMDSSESVELPLDYLQGHKDGLEWAAQLVEANHPETGDWLYDDPIELSKAIRKGPDMPPVQPAPVVPDDVLKALQKVARIRLDMDGFDGDRRGISDCLCDAEEALIEVVNRRAAMLAAAQQPQNAPQNIPEIIPDCWCLTCRPVVLNDMRFVVCPDCGNKRCPRANDHRNACTGSNEPGQEGGAYPDIPREVK
ncbi:Uncharacterised protein [Klebsiella pneumoniae]|uniref:hypothetical protein n=1 Tax=Klebsiella pneumoniae TaxID=573 RepID=UPI0007CC47B1|nr:hypothetical protein [Klebsiella pneumoniae]SAT92396.1 Uncharacterised protein [Klebsiella pneumoniae]